MKIDLDDPRVYHAIHRAIVNNFTPESRIKSNAANEAMTALRALAEPEAAKGEMVDLWIQPWLSTNGTRLVSAYYDAHSANICTKGTEFRNTGIIFKVQLPADAWPGEPVVIEGVTATEVK